MHTFFGKVRKINGTGVASVSVEIVPSSKFQVTCDLTSPVEVELTDGNVVEPIEFEVTCMSGARYARHLFPLSESRIVVRTVRGTIARVDI